MGPCKFTVMLRSLRLAHVLSLSACFPFVPVTCHGAGPAGDVGQFGGYAGPFKFIRLPSGDTLTVYRVKYWTFTDNAPPALQLEYQTRVSIADTAAIRGEVLRLWPVFQPYVERAGFGSAILTATDREVKGGATGHLSSMRHYGTVIARDSAGSWRIVTDGTTLPSVPHDSSHATTGVGIFERNGQPLMTR